MTLSNHYYSWGIPPAFWPLMEKRPQQEQDVLSKCKDWMVGDKPFCILSGDNGTGKTTLACHMLKSWMQAQYAKKPQKAPESRFVKQGMMYHQWLDEMRSGSVYGLLQRYFEPDLLVLDDMGVKVPTEGFREWLISLIDRRMDYCQRTIITTNLNAKAMKEAYGETMVSRILVGTQIKLIGGDRRRD